MRVAQTEHALVVRHSVPSSITRIIRLPPDSTSTEWSGAPDQRVLDTP